MSPRAARVRAVLAAARRLADAHDPLGREARARLPESTGLSAEGVALALSRHLELTASDDELSSLLASVEEAPRAHVVLSANVFTAASRALALALASSSKVVLRPSRREPVFPELLLRALDEGEVRAELLLSHGLPFAAGDVVHAYGRDATLRSIAASLPAGATFLGHGSGFGVAALDQPTAIDAGALADDVIAFDQRGCLSPRLVLVRACESAVVAFAESLSAELSRRLGDVPLGAVDAAERASRRAYLDTMAMTGRALGAEGSHVGVDLSPRALILPEGARVVHVARALDEAAAWRLLAPLAGKLTALGGEGALAAWLATRVPLARRSALGQMQRPRFDGPVDRRPFLV